MPQRRRPLPIHYYEGGLALNHKSLFFQQLPSDEAGHRLAMRARFGFPCWSVPCTVQ
jgi:hypothetical protein